MRNLQKDTKDMHYALFDEKVPIVNDDGDETGYYDLHYKKTCSFKASISAGVSKASREMFGTDVVVEKTISTTNLRLPIDENSLIWLESSVVLLENGKPDASTADYEVSAKPIVSLNQLVIPLKRRAKNA